MMRHLLLVTALLTVLSCATPPWGWAATPTPETTALPTSTTTATPALKNVYKWVDDKGKTHYGDIPPNTQTAPITLPALPLIKGGMPPTSATTPTPSAAPQVAYQVTINNPHANETLYSNDGSVAVSVSVYPALVNQHALIVFVDGRSFNFAGAGTYNLSVGEGLHTLQAQVVDTQNRVLSATGVIEFTLKFRHLFPPLIKPWSWWQPHHHSPTPMSHITPAPKPTKENFSAPFK